MSIGDVNSDARGSGARYNDGKVALDLIPGIALEDCARVFDYGRNKYAAWNWAKGMKWMVVFACLLRHLYAWARGEDNDTESGLPHLGHAMCNLVMLSTFSRTYREGDDRPKGLFDVPAQTAADFTVTRTGSGEVDWLVSPNEPMSTTEGGVSNCAKHMYETWNAANLKHAPKQGSRIATDAELRAAGLAHLVMNDEPNYPAYSYENLPKVGDRVRVIAGKPTEDNGADIGQVGTVREDSPQPWIEFDLPTHQPYEVEHLNIREGHADCLHWKWIERIG